MEQVAVDQASERKGAWRILIVDDHPLVRAGMRSLIESEPDLRVCGEASGIADALDAARVSTPDLVVTDLSLVDGNGLELIKRLRARDADCKILVCSMHDENLFAHRALAAGALGYIGKDEATAHVVDAIRETLRGRNWMSRAMAERMFSGMARGHAGTEPDAIATLSDRELEVFELIGRGFGPTQIAEQIHLSVKTVETHREKIKKKLNLRSGSELMRRALLWTSGQR